jgi:DNA primase
MKTGSSSLDPGWRMPGIDYRQVRSMVSMTEVLSLLGFAAARSAGNQLRGPCPRHDSVAAKSRVFSVNLAKNTFPCFKCKAAGNHLDLWAAATKQALYDASVELCKRLNRPIPWIGPQQRRGTRPSGKHA